MLPHTDLASSNGTSSDKKAMCYGAHCKTEMTCPFTECLKENTGTSSLSLIRQNYTERIQSHGTVPVFINPTFQKKKKKIYGE
jgi:hypothetical protein